ncbi:MAG: hypothetical protein A3F17_05165 [Gammaproteobacteria bacterium RIFCSPHIGHO2_12_FULL_41_15]|nr:MAG: hypothetical protein A3F17_05165 [Gammaproteobacteria bacterium RIFCSPHIGHO2_12_FULL_41_15]
MNFFRRHGCAELTLEMFAIWALRQPLLRGAQRQILNLESAVEGVARKLKVLKIGIFLGLFN